jgi:hypothetical protein
VGSVVVVAVEKKVGTAAARMAKVGKVAKVAADVAAAERE